MHCKTIAFVGAGAMLGLLMGAGAARADDWKTIFCDDAPISVGASIGGETCKTGYGETSTRVSCYAKDFIVTGKTDSGTFFIYLHRLEAGQCHMPEMANNEMAAFLKQILPQATDWGEVRRLGDAYTIDFKFQGATCFGYSEHGSVGIYNNGFKSNTVGEFCTADAAGYDDDKKRSLIASVKIAP